MENIIAQIVKEVVSGMHTLERTRKRIFLNWLSAHSAQVDCARQENPAECLEATLPRWLRSLDVPGLLWEYRLLLHEIEWCAELEQGALEQFLREQA